MPQFLISAAGRQPRRVFVTQNSGQGIRIGFARAHKTQKGEEEEEVEKAKEPEESPQKKKRTKKTNM